MKKKILFLGVLAIMSLNSYSNDKVMGKNPDTNVNVEEDVNSSTTVRDLKNHGYVDLGLPSGLLWATCNMGANSSADYGDYYSFGEVKAKMKKENPWKNLYYRGRWSDVEVTEEKIKGNSKYDAATAKWGGSWRLPTADEIDELIDECTWEWTRNVNSKGKKVFGYKVTGPNNNSIFLPAAGYWGIKRGTDGKKKIHDVKRTGTYLSCSPSTVNESSDLSYSLYFYYINPSNKKSLREAYLRGIGQSVRPVSE
ncbi:MAG: hypothetical protein LUC18_03015 [Porphyromonadaceae bacterium]|nr:hypothetical protein [Porphyromonadaceae bacterium]